MGRIVKGYIVRRKLKDIVESFGVRDDYQNPYVQLNASKTSRS